MTFSMLVKVHGRMRSLLAIGLTTFLAATVFAQPPGYVDGTDWADFSADYKLALVQATQEELRDREMTTKYSGEFYRRALNEVYHDPNNLRVSLGDAMSLIGFPLGDFEQGQKILTDAR